MSRDYIKYRGKCKEMVDELCKNDATLTPVRGHYICWLYGKQPHWWAVNSDGEIIDPTVKQFAKPYIGEYIPLDGIVQCSECRRIVKEDLAIFYRNYAFCSANCNMRFVGL